MEKSKAIIAMPPIAMYYKGRRMAFLHLRLVKIKVRGFYQIYVSFQPVGKCYSFSCSLKKRELWDFVQECDKIFDMNHTLNRNRHRPLHYLMPKKKVEEMYRVKL